MGFLTHIVPVFELSQVGEARQLAVSLSRSILFSDVAVSNVAIAVTEMGINLVKHAGGGEILLRICRELDGRCVEVIALDKGPGMIDPNECLRDGFSSAGSSGTGLGAIRRLSQEFDIYSMPEHGAAILARFHSYPHCLQAPHIQVGVVQRPYPGERVCGDDWIVQRDGAGLRLCLADGLGHGPEAAVAARRATTYVGERKQLALVPLLKGLHAALRGTRGAAVAIAQFSQSDRCIRFSGLGNVVGVIGIGPKKQMVSRTGTVGVAARRFEDFSYWWPLGAITVFHSDGLSSKWDLSSYPGLANRHASLIAAILLRDGRRELDDATVIVVRELLPSGGQE